jgi:drug/metabolite transporter (DMT)-like permease
MLSYFYALVCVVALSAGQVLFKAAAIASNENSSLMAPKPLSLLGAAMLIYASASLLWVWVLRNEDLGRIYPIMALAFVLVPLGSHLFFGEEFPLRYFLGTAIIMLGLFLTSQS